LCHERVDRLPVVEIVDTRHKNSAVYRCMHR
jgi:hypothetical protein